MKKFIYKILFYGVLPILLIISFVIVSNKFLQNYPLTNSMEAKSSMLHTFNDSINIIIAGDSRAEQQLIPEIIKQKTGFNTINIAIGAGDLITTSYALDSYNSTKNIFIISASSFQINDGAIEGYISLKSFQLLTFSETYNLFSKNRDEYFSLQKDLWKNIIKQNLGIRSTSYDDEVIKNFGFLGFKDTLFIDNKKIKRKINSHPWYKNINNDGARWRIFKDALNKLGKTNNLIIIYQPPVSPIFKKTITNSIDTAEKQYSKKLELLCNQYENIKFYDFYNHEIELLDDSMYSEPQHLNVNGAKIFSTIISEIVLEEK